MVATGLLPKIIWMFLCLLSSYKHSIKPVFSVMYMCTLKMYSTNQLIFASHWRWLTLLNLSFLLTFSVCFCRLKPLKPVNVKGPSIEKCRGIVSGKYEVQLWFESVKDEHRFRWGCSLLKKVKKWSLQPIFC